MIPQALHTTPYLTVDTETTGLYIHQGDRPFAVSFTTFEGEDHYVRWRVDPKTRVVSFNKEELQEITGLLTSRSERKLGTVFHNASFDLSMLYAACCDCEIPWNPLEISRGLPLQGVLDTVILAHAANSARDSYALKPLCRELLNIPMGDQSDLQADTVAKRRAGKKLGYNLSKAVEADYHLADSALCETYAIQDTRRTMALLKMFLPLFNERGTGLFFKFKEITEMEHEFQLAVLDINLRGVRISESKVAELQSYYSLVLAEHMGTLAELGYGDLNPRSPAQKAEIFFNQLGFAQEIRKRKGKDGSKKNTVSCDKKALAKFAETNKLADTLLHISEAQHQLNSFINPFAREAVHLNGRSILFPNFNSVGPRTGRLSCSHPNLQNITSPSSPNHKTNVALRARECFIPRHGCAWALADYEQVEIWVAAFLSKDKLMCETLLSGLSVHDVTCDKVFGPMPDFKEKRSTYRKLAKILTFSILYGSGPKALAELLNVTLEEARIYYKNFWATYVGLRKYADELERQIRTKGYVHDIFGRIFFLTKEMAYKALNYVVQGSAAGILKRAHLAVFKLFKEAYKGAKIILSIHDELIMEVPMKDLSHKFVDQVREAMAGSFHKLLGMPNPFKIGFSFTTKSWQEKIDYEV